mgnify:CR=1 FL=1
MSCILKRYGLRDVAQPRLNRCCSLRLQREGSEQAMDQGGCYNDCVLRRCGWAHHLASYQVSTTQRARRRTFQRVLGSEQVDRHICERSGGELFHLVRDRLGRRNRCAGIHVRLRNALVAQRKFELPLPCVLDATGTSSANLAAAVLPQSSWTMASSLRATGDVLSCDRRRGSSCALWRVLATPALAKRYHFVVLAVFHLLSASWSRLIDRCLRLPLYSAIAKQRIRKLACAAAGVDTTFPLCRCSVCKPFIHSLACCSQSRRPTCPRAFQDRNDTQHHAIDAASAPARSDSIGEPNSKHVDSASSASQGRPQDAPSGRKHKVSDTRGAIAS